MAAREGVFQDSGAKFDFKEVRPLDGMPGEIAYKKGSPCPDLQTLLKSGLTIPQMFELSRAGAKQDAGARQTAIINALKEAGTLAPHMSGAPDSAAMKQVAAVTTALDNIAAAGLFAGSASEIQHMAGTPHMPDKLPPFIEALASCTTGPSGPAVKGR